MERIHQLLAEGFSKSQEIIGENDRKFKEVEETLESYLTRAKETLQKKHLINPKPVKRAMRGKMKDLNEDCEDEEEPPIENTTTPAGTREYIFVQPELPVAQESSGLLRPIRSAKVKAAENLKEQALNVKMRNDQNVVTIKTERSSTMSSSNSRESIKENKVPEKDIANQKRKSPDEGIQSATESEGALSKNSKRGSSIELISNQLVSIDITADDRSEIKPPPDALSKKPAKKTTRTKQKAQPIEEPEPEQPVHTTRLRIKQEKVSHISPQAEAVAEVAPSTVTVTTQNESKVVDDSAKGKKAKKKYPMPLLIKIEPNEEKLKEPSAVLEPQTCNDTYRVEPAVNDTVTIAPAVNETVTIVPANGNTTVTLTKNTHDSLMTSDNDDEQDNSLFDIPPALPIKPKAAPNFKKNEVFNPYVASPVKQKVQAFEKHAAFPDKFNTLPAKLNTFKSGTPSKIAMFKSATPLSLGKYPKFATSSTGSLLTSSQGNSLKKPSKLNSLSHESLEETRKNQEKAMMEEKRKLREEKMRQAQLQREANDKEKRDQMLKLQQERDEKYRKIMCEKEEKQRMEAMKKKLLKEKQAKKYAEEKAKKDEFLVPKAVEPQTSALSKSDSMYKKLHKSIISTKKKYDSNVYSFDMLNTDDETDDESRPSAKRPPIPEWSLKRARKPLMQTQSYVNSDVLDVFFGTAPISVDLRAIFPSIEAKKLVRNSSAIWRTPPKSY